MLPNSINIKIDVRSSLSFIVFAVVVVSTSFFLLFKISEALDELDDLSSSPFYGSLRRENDTESAVSANWKTYRNEEYGFEVKYPDGWSLDDQFNSFGFDGGIVIRSSESHSEIYPFVMFVLAKRGSYGNSRRAFETVVRPTLRTDIDHEVRDIEFNGYDAVSFIDLGISETKNIILVRRDRMIEISYASDKDASEDDIPYRDHILSSFRFFLK